MLCCDLQQQNQRWVGLEAISWVEIEVCYAIFSFLWNRCAGGREVGLGFFSRLFFYWRVASLLKNKNNIYGWLWREERGLTEKCE